MFYVGTCPHCLKHDLAMQVVQTHKVSRFDINLYFLCPNCKYPSCATCANPAEISPENLRNISGSTEDARLKIVCLWPSLPEPNIPAHVPVEVSRALAQAESNFHKQEHEEAAAIMYRRALENGIKIIAPEAKGTLAARIGTLGENGILTKDLVTWSKEIKNLGNDGAHELDGISREELVAMRGLTEMVLKYLFTLPETVRLLREPKTS